MTPRQQRIKDALYDDLQSFRFVKLNDPAAETKLYRLIVQIDEAMANEMLEMPLLIRDKKTGRVAKLTREVLT